jgi:DNA repair protein RecN (Recombination protein N)
VTADEPPAGRLVELAVTDLGIIAHTRVLFGPGMTALTGETGAGKTLLVGAIDLLLGGRADPAMVRTGATEAVVEGRFAMGDDDLVLTRVVPVDGRSRAYIDGRLATAAALADAATAMVDLHGQHAHQSLLAAKVQRDALDRFGEIDLEPLRAARAERRRVAEALDALGGDAGARAREADLLRYQLAELEGAALADADEDERLAEEESVLSDTVALQEAAAAAGEALGSEGGATDQVGAALAAVEGRAFFGEVADRLRGVQAELADLAEEIRHRGEEIVDRPERAEEVRLRRQLLADLRRKYGTAPHPDGSGGQGSGALADVLAYQAAVGERLAEIDAHDERAAALDDQARKAAAAEAKAAAAVAKARKAAAPDLAKQVEGHLAELAMASARLTVEVEGDGPADDVVFLLAANPGSAPGPLAKVASGGELARAMLALRLVLSAAPPVLVFDEVDAGIGGQAALAVGRSLAALGTDHQVLVVTHLPQVAAFADGQVSVRKDSVDGATVAAAAPLDDAGRVVELSRMLAGTPESERVQDAATELLDLAARERGR